MRQTCLSFIALAIGLSFLSTAWCQQSPSAQDYMQNAQVALQDNDMTTAIEDYLLAIKVDPDAWQAYQNLGGCYIQLHRMNDAKAAYEESLAIHPNNPSLVKFINQIWAGSPTSTPTYTPTPTATPTSTSMVMISPQNVSPTPTPTFFSSYVPATPTPQNSPTPVEVEVPFVAMPSQNNEPGTAPFKGFKPYVFQALPSYNLPYKNSITFDFGGDAWFGSIQNFNDFFGPDLVPPASSHTGWEIDAGADYTLTRSIQIGLRLEGIISPVTQSQLGSQFVGWDSYCVGSALEGKYIIPLNSAMSLIFHAEGGYYTLVGSSISYDQGDQGTIGLGGSALGGLAEVQLELFQVEDKSMAIDFGLGYRFLRFNNLTGTGSNGLTVSGPLLNANGTPAYVDYSGPRLSLAIRFVH